MHICELKQWHQSIVRYTLPAKIYIQSQQEMWNYLNYTATWRFFHAQTVDQKETWVHTDSKVKQLPILLGLSQNVDIYLMQKNIY